MSIYAILAFVGYLISFQCADTISDLEIHLVQIEPLSFNLNQIKV